MVAEICGRDTGLGGGRAGHMIVADYDSGIVGGTAVVGGNITVATGVGLSIKLRHSDQVVICFFGDGASSTGSFHEGINLAAVWKLPVVFICENNQYALSTSLKYQIAEQASIAKRGLGYGIPGVEVDGNDILEVYYTTKDAVERARRGNGPSLIEAKTYRVAPFSTRDRGGYRSDSEVEEFRKNDPILNLEKLLAKKRIFDNDTREGVYKQAQKTIEDAIQFALDSPWPDPKTVFHHLYKEASDT
jgi:pyruvate dehydrogenase E1 component alpha subunit